MKITWLGHSGFRIQTEGQVLLIDPWLSGNPMFPEAEYETAIEGVTHILLTHAHFDHVADVLPLAKRLGIPVVGQYDVMAHWAEAEGIETIGFNKGGCVNLKGIKVDMVPASHSSTFSTPDGPRSGGSEVGFVIAAESHTIYVSGDTSIMADMEWIGDYYKPDIGILSAGGYFTMDMRAAAYAAKRYFDFKTVIPCHYKTFPVLEQSATGLADGLPGVNVIEAQVLEVIEL